MSNYQKFSAFAASWVLLNTSHDKAGIAIIIPRYVPAALTL